MCAQLWSMVAMAIAVVRSRFNLGAGRAVGVVGSVLYNRYRGGAASFARKESRRKIAIGETHTA